MLKKHTFEYVQDALLLLVMCVLLFIGASRQLFATYSDVAKYQCYAVAFWQGLPALDTFPKSQCQIIVHPTQSSDALSQAVIVSKMRQLGLPAALVQFVAAQSPRQPYHALPHEYPLLTLVPFLLALPVPVTWYQVVFAIWMALVALIICLVLRKWRSRSAALVCAVYLVLGAWGTALGRFDLLPSCLTLIALVCAERKFWKWAFALLAVATLLKFYPLELVIPFWLAQQLTVRKKWYAWQRWAPAGVFLLVCTIVIVVSLLLNVEGTLAPLSYFSARPIQVESLAASSIWLLSGLRGDVLTYAYTFGSLNVFSPLSSGFSLLFTILSVVGVVYTYWLQWRGKIDLALACVLTLLVTMVTSKVFSPQYLIWIVPLVAYVGGRDLRWLISWSVTGLLTTWIYPTIYFMTRSLLNVPALPLFYPVTTLRNFLLLGITLCLLYNASRKFRQSRVAQNVPKLEGSSDAVLVND